MLYFPLMVLSFQLNYTMSWWTRHESKNYNTTELLLTTIIRNPRIVLDIWFFFFFLIDIKIEKYKFHNESVWLLNGELQFLAFLSKTITGHQILFFTILMYLLFLYFLFNYYIHYGNISSKKYLRTSTLKLLFYYDFINIIYYTIVRVFVRHVELLISLLLRTLLK